MAPTTVGPVDWTEPRPMFFRSAGGRFEVWHVEALGYWVAYDFDRPKRFPASGPEECFAWCAERALEAVNG